MKRFFRHYFGGLYHRLGAHAVFLMAGGLSFSFLTCILPLMLVMLSMLGNILAASSVEREIDVFTANFFPYTQYAEPLKAFLLSRVDAVIAYRKVAGYSGAFGLVLTASGMFSSMRTILNKVFRVSTDVHLVVGKLRDFGMVLLVLIFFLISTTIFPVIENVKDFATKLPWLQALRVNSTLQALFPGLFFCIILGVFFVLYYLIPYEKLGKGATMISAFFATALWEMAEQIFGYYLSHGASLGKIYGAYIFIVVGVLWIYYSALVFILGAEIGQLYRERAMSVSSGMEIDMGSKLEA